MRGCVEWAGAVAHGTSNASKTGVNPNSLEQEKAMVDEKPSCTQRSKAQQETSGKRKAETGDDQNRKHR